MFSTRIIRSLIDSTPKEISFRENYVGKLDCQRLQARLRDFPLPPQCTNVMHRPLVHLQQEYLFIFFTDRGEGYNKFGDFIQKIEKYNIKFDEEDDQQETEHFRKMKDDYFKFRQFFPPTVFCWGFLNLKENSILSLLSSAPSCYFQVYLGSK